MKCLISYFLLAAALFQPLQATEARAAKQGKLQATSIAWASVGISLLVVVGVIVAMTIHEHK